MVIQSSGFRLIARTSLQWVLTRSIVLSLLLCGVLASLHAQPLNVPDVVENALTSRYTSAEEVKWALSEKGDYIATFLSGEDEICVAFTGQGEWSGSITCLDHGNVPVAIHRAVERYFAEYEMYDVVRVESRDVEAYFEAILESDTEALLVRFSDAGALLYQEKMDLDAE
jgi:hypothetical protein